MKRPSTGDIIEHTNAYGDVVQGKVVLLLSAQFVYETEKGRQHYCLFRETWRHVNERNVGSNKRI